MSNVILSDGWKQSQTLGTGGFGTVQLWLHIESGEKLAIKKCKWDYSQLTPIQQKRWIKEVNIMQHLRHPNIVKTRCIPFKLPDVEEKLPILCMEYCRKGDLRKILNQPENCCGINEIEVIKIMSQISSAIEYLHSCKITHRDLKPENIVLQDENNILSYKLIDLGYAKELGEASASASLVGTLNYVAPELLWRKKYSCSVDYWSLGILFYEIVTGVRPFLPTMQHTMEWMKHIQNKSYDDIYAYESEGKVIFGKDIQNPTHLSDCLRHKMVKWFRLVLQWDPHKRGKQLDEHGTSHLAVFTMLRQILPEKILYVFCVPFYKINTYEINSSTTVKDLQLLIEQDTNIKIQYQILTNYNGTILVENTSSLMSQTNDDILFVFKDGCFLPEDVSMPDIPTVVRKMITQSRFKLNFEVLKDYYRHTIYFAKEQVNLFQLYIFAFSINVDLLYNNINTFNMNMEKTLKITKALINKVHTFRTMYINIADNRNTTEKKTLEIYFDKIDKLLIAADQIKMEFISLKDNNDKLKSKSQDINHITDLSNLYNEICDIYLEFKKESFHKTMTPLNMAKLMFAFMNSYGAQFHNENMIDITRQIDKLRNDLLKLEKIFNSVTVMTKLYWIEYNKIVQLSANTTSQQHNDQLLNISTELKVIQSEDNIVYDNLVIRYTLDNLMAEIQKKYLEIISFDS